MLFKRSLIIVGFGTQAASIRLLSTMYQHVLLENQRPMEVFETLVASLRLLLTMYQHVPLEMILLLEGFGTLAARGGCTVEDAL